MMAGDALPRLLRDVVGRDHVLEDPELKAPFERDWTGRFHGSASLVVRPGSPAEAAAALERLAAAGAPVVPQGGNTGLVGGGVPRGGEVLLSLGRLRAIEEFDETGREVTVGAGLPLSALQTFAATHGLEVGVDLAARDSATVGGMVATNAGGVAAMRHGPMRSQIVGLEAVLADGRLLRRLPGLLKDNSGYHLPGLLAGSEGTLAVITRVRVRLLRRRPFRVTALAAVDGTAAALEALGQVRHRLPLTLEAAELFFDEGLELVLAHGGGARPFPDRHPAYLLLECAAAVDPLHELAQALEQASPLRDVVVATERRQRRQLWHLREGLTEAINTQGVPHKLDIAVPLPRLPELERRIRELVAGLGPTARVILFGHVGDGNLHVNIVGLEPEDETADEAVFRLAAELGGSISAEHGIGVAKRRWLPLTRSPEELDAMRAIKSGLDPRGLLNPGVLFAAAPPPTD